MDQEVNISNKEWAKWTSKINEVSILSDQTAGKVSKHDEKFDAIDVRINVVEDNHISLPLAIKQAVEDGMAPLMQKLIDHDEKFVDIALFKEREEKDRALRQIEEEKERKSWFMRTIWGSVIATIVGPAITILGYIIWNNR